MDGLFPYNPDAVDFSKCLETELFNEEEDASESLLDSEEEASILSTSEYKVALKVIKHVLGPIKSNFCFNCVQLSPNDLYDLYAKILHRASEVSDERSTSSETPSSSRIQSDVEINLELPDMNSGELLTVTNHSDTFHSVSSQLFSLPSSFHKLDNNIYISQDLTPTCSNLLNSNISESAGQLSDMHFESLPIILMQAPTTVAVFPAPATAVVSPAPATAVVSPAPATTVVSPAPATAVDLPAPATAVDLPAPATAVVSPAPATAVVSPAPATAVVSPAPATAVVSPAPATAVVAPAPATVCRLTSSCHCCRLTSSCHCCRRTSSCHCC